jgi:hypothetical protein
MRFSVGLWALIFSVSCSDPKDDTARVASELVDANAWSRVVGSDDPFEGAGGSDDDCDESAFGPEDFGGELAFEVRTDICPRVTVAQPALAGLRAGDEVFIRGWHERLTAPEAAEAVLALAIAGKEVWRETIPIPQDGGGIVLGELVVGRDYDAGTAIAWHVHNHGQNGYQLLEVSGGPPSR